jgi:argininosuccinate synthase
VGDTIIGIKGRVGFEAAALIIIKAHHLLEKHTLGKWQQYWRTTWKLVRHVIPRRTVLGNA